VKAGSSQRAGEPWREKGPGELRAESRPNPLSSVADSRVEQNPEDGGACDGRLKRQEGNGAGNGVRLRGRNKALEGDPKSGSGMKQGRQARGGSGARRLREPEGAGGRGVEISTKPSRCRERGNAEGAKTSWEASPMGAWQNQVPDFGRPKP